MPNRRVGKNWRVLQIKIWRFLSLGQKVSGLKCGGLVPGLEQRTGDDPLSALFVAFLAIAALSVFIGYVCVLNRWPAIGIISAASVVLLSWEMPQIPPLMNAGGSSIYLVDGIAVACLIVAVKNVRQLIVNLGAGAGFMLALMSLIVISLVRGIFEFGIGPATNEFRLFLYPFGCLLWAMSLEWGTESRFRLLRVTAVWLGWLLVLVAGIHMLRFGLGGASEFTEDANGLEQTTRPLVSGQALVLLMCAAVSLWLWKAKTSKVYLFHGVVFGMVVLLVQQRTVWSVAIAAVAAIFLFSSGRTKGTVLASCLAAGLALLLCVYSGVAAEIFDQLQAAAENSGTYDARVVSWTNLLDESIRRGMETVVFGSPMGSGFGRLEGFDRWVTFAPHNWYLTVYLRAGLIGLLLFVGFLVSTFWRAVRYRVNMAALAILTIMAVYGWSYSWLWYTSIFAGWAYSSAGLAQALNGGLGRPRPVSENDRSSLRSTT